MYYSYQAIGPSGQSVSDSERASSRETLAEGLAARGFEVVELRLDWRRSLAAVFSRSQVKRAALIEFFSHLKGLLALGLNTTAAIETVQASTGDPMLSRALRKVEDLIGKGYSLSQAMELIGVFPTLAVASVDAAERTSRLEEAAGELASHYRNVEELASAARKAATYPLIALGVLLAVLTMMLLMVVPGLRGVLPPEPPLPTRVLLWMSGAAESGWWLLPLMPVAVWMVYHRVTPEKRAYLWQKLYRVPLVGPMALNLELATVFMNLSMLTSGGIPLLDALRIATANTTSAYIRSRLTSCYELARHGGKLSEGFADTDFPSLISRAIVHGEATGQYEEPFAGIARFLREQTAGRIRFLSNFIEPALILLGGGMLLLMALAVFMPLYEQLRHVTR